MARAAPQTIMQELQAELDKSREEMVKQSEKLAQVELSVAKKVCCRRPGLGGGCRGPS